MKGAAVGLKSLTYLTIAANGLLFCAPLLPLLVADGANGFAASASADATVEDATAATGY